MKIHRPIAIQIPIALDHIFKDGYFADKVIEKQIKKVGSKWGGRDRRFFAESIYDIVRWRRRLQECLPDYLKEESWGLFEAWLIVKNLDLPKMEEFYGLNADNVIQSFESEENFAVWSSYPDWLVQRFFDELGPDKSRTLLESMNKMARVYLRGNPLIGDVYKLKKELKSEGIEGEVVDKKLSTFGLIERKNVFVSKAFKLGMFEVQDYGSQQLAPLLEAEPGQRVMDACAGAGGKSLHLAQIMGNKGKIIACDIHEWKLKELKKRAKRNKVDLIETRVIDSKWVKRQQGKFDRLLLDVPCSGTGVFKRNPDSKWKLSNERIQELIEIQREILSKYSVVVKPGGKMVYATCSVLPSENQAQVDWFLENNSDWELEEKVNLFPDENSTDGFFGARLVKK